MSSYRILNSTKRIVSITFLKLILWTIFEIWIVRALEIKTFYFFWHSEKFQCFFGKFSSFFYKVCVICHWTSLVEVKNHRIRSIAFLVQKIWTAYIKLDSFYFFGKNFKKKYGFFQNFRKTLIFLKRDISFLWVNFSKETESAKINKIWVDWFFPFLLYAKANIIIY
jgi:hypothetical protein